ncbi:MAG: Fic family protein [Solirubrobacteraceae bacterium]
MIFSTPTLGPDLAERLATLDELRRRLGERAGGVPMPWLGQLRRHVKAAAARSSVSIEGYEVSEAQSVALAGGEHGEDGDEAQLALVAYARAMDHVGVMAEDPAFSWSERAILDLHFDACLFQRDKRPGRWRDGPISVTSPDGGPPEYVGPPAELVLGLMGEVVDWLEHGDLDAHVVVRASMAHLNVISVHPFADGNGRVSRIVQSLVLARAGLLTPELGSIEEYLGRNTASYYRALRETQGGSYQPERDASGWVGFCLDAHIVQAEKRLEQIEQAAVRWGSLEALAEDHSWPDRIVIALEQSLFEGASRLAYSTEAGVSLVTAGGDFRRLLDAGLVAREGRTRNTRYVASEALRGEVERALSDGALDR